MRRSWWGLALVALACATVCSTVYATEAPRALADCSRVSNPEATALVAEGDAARGSNIDLAIERYTEATKVDPDDEGALWKLAQAYAKKEDWAAMAGASAKAGEADARAHAKKTNADYAFSEGRARAAMASHGAGSWADAHRAFTEAVAIDPNYGEAFGELGFVLLHEDDESGALRNWSIAIGKDPTKGQYYVPLADLYRRLLLWDKEALVLETALSRVVPTDKWLYELHALKGELDDARADFAGMVIEYEAARAACAPDHCARHREAPYNLGMAYARTTPPRKAEALQMLREFMVVTCKGAAASKFAKECAAMMETTVKLGGVP